MAMAPNTERLFLAFSDHDASSDVQGPYRPTCGLVSFLWRIIRCLPCSFSNFSCQEPLIHLATNDDAPRRSCARMVPVCPIARRTVAPAMAGASTSCAIPGIVEPVACDALPGRAASVKSAAALPTPACATMPAWTCAETPVIAANAAIPVAPSRCASRASVSESAWLERPAVAGAAPVSTAIGATVVPAEKPAPAMNPASTNDASRPKAPSSTVEATPILYIPTSPNSNAPAGSSIVPAHTSFAWQAASNEHQRRRRVRAATPWRL